MESLLNAYRLIQRIKFLKLYSQKNASPKTKHFFMINMKPNPACPDLNGAPFVSAGKSAGTKKRESFDITQDKFGLKEAHQNF
ncbi:hypothetical protein [Chryseobacterium sp. Leaf394]|uniref:hypothetical protein n=1 Tax=Chryseobacterium sp. Leaf394 TaxID=1736361 RepID=UPI0006F89636|nr:hypothetical protein [Chryseobacterium sp. Leaf394]KQS91329.1 hypothetical protein ASG21_02265 [Chryseobacterium sp. Leaf394]